MRILLTLGIAALMWPAPAAPADSRLQWPLRPAPAILRSFDAPSPNWLRGHRGVDLAGSPDQAVFAAGSGTVVYAGTLAGRPVISVSHPGGLRTSYEPVRPGVRAGQHVDAATALGALQPGHRGCGRPTCLHWGAMWGPAADAAYIDPLGLLAATPIRLRPLHG